MLQTLSEEIRLCHQRAEDCARQAKTASTAELRADYLRLERSWFELARSYELQHRLDSFINENRKPGTMGLAGMANVSVVGLAVDTAGGQVPAPSRTANDPECVQDGLVAIVDDDEYARAGLRALIESLGYASAAFASAEEYLASEMTENTACLILDVHLLGMSGPELQANLIASGRCPPIVFATGRFEEHVRKRVIAAGALGYLTKPCSQKALLDCIGKALRAAA